MLNLEKPDFDFFFRSGSGFVCVVSGHELRSSFIVAPDQLITDWPVTSSSLLTTESLAPVLALSPEVIVLGTGESQVFPPASVMKHCLSLRIGLEVMNNASAARTFNILAGEGRKVVGAVILNT